MSVIIIDYGAGNCRSVQLALSRLHVHAEVTDDEKKIRTASRVIFPGVGNAGAAMARLREKKLDTVIPSLTKPVLGICLGLQLLGSYSEEESTPCLSIIPEIEVRKFTRARTVPHVGWSLVNNFGSPLFKGIFAERYFYFVHSYFMAPNPFTVGACSYEEERFSAAIQYKNFFGVQFHPEKSGKIGEQLLHNFLTETL